MGKKRGRVASALRARLVATNHRRRGYEDGFTLIELLIVVVILPLVIGAVAIAMITALEATDAGPESTAQRLAETHDAQITSAYFVRDVQGAQLLTTASAVASEVCAQSGQSVTQQLLGLEWDSGGVKVSYVEATVGTASEILRNFCANGTVSTSTIVYNVSSVTGPTLACNTTLNTNDTTCQSDSASALISTVRVLKVKIDVTGTSGFKYELIASPRQLLTSGPSNSGSAPTLLVADGGTCDGQMTVDGTAAVNYGTLDFKTAGGTFSGNQVYEGTTTLNDGVLQSGSSTLTSASGPFNANMLGESVLGNGISANTTIKNYNSSTSVTLSKNASANESGDSVTIGPNSAINPTYMGPTTTGPPLPDPYANLPAPSASEPDVHIENAAFSPGGGTISPGIYVIQAGMSITGNTALTVGAPLADGTDGVFFYVTGGAVKIGGTASINLSAISQGPWANTYGGILVYQVASDTSNMILDGSGAATTLNGVIAAPTAQLTLNGGGSGAGLTAFGLEAGTIKCNGAGTSIGLGPLVATNTALVSSVNPSAPSQTVTFMATVTPVTSLSTPTGSVTFEDGGSTIACGGGSSAFNGTTATCTVTYASTGSHSITAVYSGDTVYLGSTSSTVVQNVEIATSTTVKSSLNPSGPTQAVTYTATVTPSSMSGTPTGAVTFMDSGSSVTCGAGSVAFNGTTATCVVTYGSAGSHTISAVYSGDSAYQGSTSPSITQTVTNTMHISALTITNSGNSGNWKAAISITVVDSTGATLGNVVVTGTWTTLGSGGSGKSGCTTAASGAAKGTCSFSTGNLSVASDTWTVTASTGLSLAGFTWQSSLDVSESQTIGHP